MSYNPQNPNGQAAMANSAPVVVASDQSAVPISAASLPLPSTAATSTKQSDGSQKSQVVDGSGNVVGTTSNAMDINIKSGNISGFSTSTKQSDGSQKSQIVDGSGNVIAATSNALNVNVRSGSVTSSHTDTAPATQNITVIDSSSSTTTGANNQSISTGTPTANSAASFTIAGLDALKLQVSGTWTGTIQPEISLDGGTTWYLNGFHQTGTNYNSGAITANAAGTTNVAGATNWRMRATGAMTGTATIKIVGTVNPNTVYIANSPQIADGTTPTQKLAINESGQVTISNTAFTANAGTNLNTSTLALESGGNLATLAGGITSSKYQTNTAQLAGTAVSVNNGTTDAGTQRVTLSSDSTGQVKLATGANTIGALSANQSVNTAQVAGTTTDTNSGNKSAGTQRIVIATDQPALTNALLVTPTPGTTGGWSKWSTPQNNSNAALVATAGGVQVKGSAGTFGGYFCYNPNSTVTYLQVFDLATSVTLGTTRPDLVFGIPANSATNLEITLGINMANAIKIAATTTASGSTAPGTGMDVTIFYK